MIDCRQLVSSFALAAGAILMPCSQPALADSPPELVTKDEAGMRDEMVSSQIEARGVRDPRVLAALRKVPRHLFVPERLRDIAYVDRPLPIGEQQTISQPYIVAAMTEAVAPKPGDKVLEIGTGSGYQAAVLAELVERVYTIEIVESLGLAAKKLLAEQGYDNVEVIIGDGYQGLPEHAPYDAIVVTAAPKEIPPPLIEQLAVGGRLVIPVGGWRQELMLVERTEKGIERHSLFPVIFVPMTGEAQKR
jgi:protein-L-isoaspartate(D-aspartate) O-methyltransferase